MCQPKQLTAKPYLDSSMQRNDPQFYKMSAKSDLMRVAQSAGRLNIPEAYDTWITFLRKALENMERTSVDKKITSDLKSLLQPKKVILHDPLSRIGWAEKVLDTACRLS